MNRCSNFNTSQGEVQKLKKEYQQSHFPASKAIYEKYKANFMQFVSYDQIQLGFVVNEDRVRLPSKITDIFKRERG